VTDAFGVVRAGYDRIGVKYRDWSSASPVRLQWINRLLDWLRPRSLVVDLGCGSGEPATRLLAEAHHVIGVDGSASQLALARSAAPSALLVQADMTRFALRPSSVDAVASFYALGHVPSHLHRELFLSIATWLRPGGVLLTTAPLGIGDDTERDWLGVPMFFGGIGEAATRRALRDAGLGLDTLEVVDEDEGDGQTARFMWIQATKGRVE
jgi:SAM-dependent methyltransferase